MSRNATLRLQRLPLNTSDGEVFPQPFAGRACRALLMPDQFERSWLLAFIEIQRRRDECQCKRGMRENVIRDEGSSNPVLQDLQHDPMTLNSPHLGSNAEAVFLRTFASFENMIC